MPLQQVPINAAVTAARLGVSRSAQFEASVSDSRDSLQPGLTLTRSVFDAALDTGNEPADTHQAPACHMAASASSPAQSSPSCQYPRVNEALVGKNAEAPPQQPASASTVATDRPRMVKSLATSCLARFGWRYTPTADRIATSVKTASSLHAVRAIVHLRISMAT
jgi:hypothetical protein